MSFCQASNISEVASVSTKTDFANTTNAEKVKEGKAFWYQEQHNRVMMPVLEVLLAPYQPQTTEIWSWNNNRITHGIMP